MPKRGKVDRPATHKNWQCEKCGKVYHNPIPVLSVTCPNSKCRTKKDKIPAEMKPVEEPK